jgi:DNA ligase-1
VIPFADLLERLLFSPGRNAKLALLSRYFATVPDPDRGLALAAIAGTLDFPAAKAGLIRELAAARTDPELFAMSYDYVGDLAETVALMWPTDGGDTAPRLSEIVARLRDTPKSALPALVEAWLDTSTPSVRLALLKLITGGMRVGATARLAKLALARLSEGRATDAEIEEIWHALAPPYESLFAWLEGRGPRPDEAGRPVFRPPMLANPLEESDLAALTADDYVAEWKWDGIRVQLLGGPEPRLFSRAGEDISASFPDIVATLTHRAVLDGELLVMRGGEVAPFADLQQRLNRKAPARTLLERFPAHVRLYDILFDDTEDLRKLPFTQRRARLESWFARANPARADLSETIAFTSLDELAALREGAREAGIEGLMLKRADSPYVPGRPRGLWWKWKRDPLTIDAVVMYAQRGHGRRSSFYSDFTFGVWDGETLVPVGRAYSGISDRELAFLDNWVRHHTTARFGPVREVEKSLVLEIAFDGAQRSTRHRSGVALRFPRIARLRRDKPAAEADTLANIANLLPGETP